MEVAAWYLNIKVANTAFTKIFLEAITNGEILANFEKKDETIIVDYIGANVGKPLHIGHMCTPNIGQSLINLYKKLGYNVIGDSHIGDWGIIFWKLILAYKLWGSEEKLKENAIDHLLELYIKVTEEIEKDDKISDQILAEITHLWTSNIKGSTIEILNYLKEKWDEKEKEICVKYLDIYKNYEQQTRDTFKLLSEGDKDSIKMWETFTRESIRFMNIQLARLNVKPDYNIGESFYEGLGLPKIENYPDLGCDIIKSEWENTVIKKFHDMEWVVDFLVKKWVATKNDDGSVWVIFPDETKLPSCILQKRDGTHGYLASDLAAIKYRSENWSPAKIVYSVDIRQELHFKQAFYIAKAAGWLNKEPHLTSPYKGEEQIQNLNSPTRRGDGGAGVRSTELFHAANWFISLKDGAMSTRTGKIIRLEALLDEAESRAEKIILEKRQDIQGEELKKLSRTIGIGAIKYGYLSKSRLTNVVFDWDEFMTFEGNSGPYIQYAYVRAKSVLWDEKNVIPADAGIYQLSKNPSFPSASFETPEEKELMKALFEYKNTLLQASRENYPHIIAGYAYELTKKFNSLYAKVPLQNETDANKRNLRLLLVDTFARILKDAFSILAIDMPERM